jgi:four helix bundle protein
VQRATWEEDIRTHGEPAGGRDPIVQHVTKLDVWKVSYQLGLDVYKASQSWPREELFGLTNQARRAATSIAANIAEGHGRYSNSECRRFGQIAHGSLCELDTHLRFAHDLGYLPADHWKDLHQALLKARQLLTAFIRHLDIRS